MTARSRTISSKTADSTGIIERYGKLNERMVDISSRFDRRSHALR